MAEKVKDLLLSIVTVCVISLILAVPIHLLWNKICMVFNCQPMTYIQAVSLQLLIQLIKPVKLINSSKKEKNKA